jgi:phosphate transport system protein
VTTTRNAFHAAIDRLQEMLFSMADAVDDMIGLAMNALATPGDEAVDRVLASDDTVDNLDIEIEKHCIDLIALQQPTARDLRFIGSALKISTDLERIGDHAVDIAKIARKLAALDAKVDSDQLLDLAGAIRRMLSDALNAFLMHDLALLEKVISDDDEIDNRYREFTAATTAQMEQNSENAVSSSYLLFAVHYLERMADHIVNIAERVSYVETGQMPR